MAPGGRQPADNGSASSSNHRHHRGAPSAATAWRNAPDATNDDELLPTEATAAPVDTDGSGRSAGYDDISTGEDDLPVPPPPSSTDPKELLQLEQAKVPLPFVIQQLTHASRTRRTAVQAILLIPLVVLFVIFAFSRYDWSGDYYTTQIVERLFREDEVPPTLFHAGAPVSEFNAPGTRFDDIDSVERWHDWLEGVLLPRFYFLVRPTESNNKAGPSGNLRAVGALRLTQFRVRNDTCTKRSSRIANNVAAPCYGEYSSNSVDRSPVVDADVALRATWAWNYLPRLLPDYPIQLSNAQRSVALSQKLTIPFRSTCPYSEASVIQGVIADYPCGGHQLDMPLSGTADPNNTWTVALTRARSLRDMKYLDSRRVRMQLVEGNVYNPPSDSFTNMRFMLELGDAGTFHASVVTTTFRLFSEPLGSSSSMLLDVFYYMAVLFHTVLYFTQIVNVYSLHKRELGPKHTFLLSLYETIFDMTVLRDATTLALLWAAMIRQMQWYQASLLFTSAQQQQALAAANRALSAAGASPVATTSQSAGLQLSNLITTTGVSLSATVFNEELFFLRNLRLSQEEVHAAAVILLFIRLVSLSSIHPRLHLISRTLLRAADQLLGVLVLTVTICLAYALSGTLLFGANVNEFRNLSYAFSSLVRSIFGKFDYDALRIANRPLVFVYFWSFVLISLFTLLNFFGAVMALAYEYEAQDTVEVPMDVVVRRYLRRLRSTKKDILAMFTAVFYYATLKRRIRQDVLLEYCRRYSFQRRTRHDEFGPQPGASSERDGAAYVLSQGDDGAGVLISRRRFFSIIPASDIVDLWEVRGARSQKPDKTAMFTINYLDDVFLEIAEDYQLNQTKNDGTAKREVERDLVAGISTGLVNGLDGLVPFFQGRQGKCLYGTDVEVQPRFRTEGELAEMVATGQSTERGVGDAPVNTWGGVVPTYETVRPVPSQAGSSASSMSHHGGGEMHVPLDEYLDGEIGVRAPPEGLAGLYAFSADAITAATMMRRLSTWTRGGGTA